MGTAIGEAIRESVALAPRDENGELSRDTSSPSCCSRTGRTPGGRAQRRRRRGEGLGHSDLHDRARHGGRHRGCSERVRRRADHRGATDPETLRQIAEETGGQFFEAPTEADLQAVYEQIGSQVTYEDEERELTAAFAGAGALFLLLGASLSALWFGRIP